MLLCSVLSIFFGVSHQTYAANNVDNKAGNKVTAVNSQKQKSQKTSNSQNSLKPASSKGYEGFKVGLGLTYGLQKMHIEANKEFRDTSSSVMSSCYGGTASLAWQNRIKGNFILGIEGGVDFGSSKSARVGGILRNNPYVVARTLECKTLLTSMLNEMGRSMANNYLAVESPIPLVKEDVWKNLIGTFRYLGGTDKTADSDGFPSNSKVRNFITAKSNGLGVWDDDRYTQLADGNDHCYGYDNAQFADFVPKSIQNIRDFGESIAENGSDSALSAMRAIRNYTISYHPEVATILRYIGQNAMDSNGIKALAYNNDDDPIYDGSGDVPDLATCLLGRFFMADGLELRSITEPGIPADKLPPKGDDIAQMKTAINALLTLYHAPDGEPSYESLGKKESSASSWLKTRTSFGVCPYISVKLGYFYKELDACIYTKVGAIQLRGKVTPANDFYDIQDGKFRRFTFFAALGISKDIGDSFGIDVEISHAFKTAKKLRNILILNTYSIDHKVSLSKTSLKAVVTYSF